MHKYIYIYCETPTVLSSCFHCSPTWHVLPAREGKHLPHIFRIMRLTIGWAVERIEPSVKEQRRCSCRRARWKRGSFAIYIYTYTHRDQVCVFSVKIVQDFDMCKYMLWFYVLLHSQIRLNQVCLWWPMIWGRYNTLHNSTSRFGLYCFVESNKSPKWFS